MARRSCSDLPTPATPTSMETSMPMITCASTRAWRRGLKGGRNGDFNYEGKVNIDDYLLLDSNFIVHGPPLGTSANASMSWVSSPALIWGIGDGGRKNPADELLV